MIINSKIQSIYFFIKNEAPLNELSFLGLWLRLDQNVVPVITSSKFNLWNICQQLKTFNNLEGRQCIFQSNNTTIITYIKGHCNTFKGPNLCQPFLQSTQKDCDSQAITKIKLKSLERDHHFPVCKLYKRTGRR